MTTNWKNELAICIENEIIKCYDDFELKLSVKIDYDIFNEAFNFICCINNSEIKSKLIIKQQYIKYSSSVELFNDIVSVVSLDLIDQFYLNKPSGIIIFY